MCIPINFYFKMRIFILILELKITSQITFIKNIFNGL